MSLRENILVLLKVNASISTKSAWKRLGRRLDFPSDGDWAGHPPTDIPGNTDMPLNGIWGQLECCSWGAGLGLQVHSDCSCSPASSSGSWPMALSHGRSCRWQSEITNFAFTCQMIGMLSLAWPCTRSCFCTLMNSAKRKNTTSWAGGNKVP